MDTLLDQSDTNQQVVDRRVGSINPPVILVIEDDPTLLSTLAFNFRREEYDVLTASTGDAGLKLALAEKHRLSLIVLDLMLPGMGGLHILRQVRAVSRVPVLILSARDQEQDRIDGLELGADDYVAKPFALRELLARVRACVRRSDVDITRPAITITRGDLRIEPLLRRAFVRDIELTLRPKEFGLLLALAAEPRRVFTRQELLDQVWGEEIVVDERTIDVHLSWLRGKIARAGGQAAMISTIYGAGYCLLPAATAEAPL